MRDNLYPHKGIQRLWDILRSWRTKKGCQNFIDNELPIKVMRWPNIHDVQPISYIREK